MYLVWAQSNYFFQIKIGVKEKYVQVSIFLTK